MTLWRLSSRVSRLRETNLSIRYSLSTGHMNVLVRPIDVSKLHPVAHPARGTKYLGSLSFITTQLFPNRQYLETDSKLCAPGSSVSSLSNQTSKIALHKIQKRKWLCPSSMSA